jgi:mannose-1-phosphate guanylyltransferase
MDIKLFLLQRMNLHISLGIIHALENPEKVNLELIEVQFGSYLGEDDIVRFDDDKYGCS